MVGAVLREQHVEVHAELLDGTSLQLLDPHPLLGARHLVAMNRIGQPLQFHGQLARFGPDPLELGHPLGSYVLRGHPGLRGGAQGILDAGHHVVGDRHHGARRGQVMGRPCPTLFGLDPGLPLVCGGLAQRRRPGLSGPHSLLAGANGQPRLDFGLRRRRQRVSQARSLISVVLHRD